MPLGRTQAQLNEEQGEQRPRGREDESREAGSRGGETNHLLDEEASQYTQSR